MCPVFGGAIATADTDAARVRPGVIRVSTFAGGAGARAGVAAIARDSWTAREAVKQIDVRWNDGPHAALDGSVLIGAMRAKLDASGGFPLHERGDGAAALKRAARILQAEYSAPWLAHATLEPMNCTAQFADDGRLRIWAPTQVASVARHVAARVAGIDASRVEINVTLLGGGFGRRLESDFVAVAVQIARDTAPAPVQVLWSREEDFAHDMYRPAAVARLQAGFDADDRLTVWVTRSVSDAIAPQYMARAYPAFAADAADKTTAEGLFDQPYEIAHRACTHEVFKSPVPIGFWRAVGHSHNAFFTESFIDELAFAANRDPFEFRRDLLKNHPRHRAVLELAAARAGWGAAIAAGRARGIALHASFGSIVAQVAEVSVAGKAVRVHRVVCAIDCGVAVNPDIVAQQMESGIVFGLTAALFGDITIAKGRVMQSSFAEYPMALLRDAPAIETHIVPSERTPGGVGEPGLPPIAPAIANALFALSGQRLRSLPLRLS
jgi:isoquinoline 1-oxidoreductase beta subunit